MRRLSGYFLFFAILFYCPSAVWAQAAPATLTEDAVPVSLEQFPPDATDGHPRDLLIPDQNTLKTKYSIVHYTNDKDIDDFIWRLGGQRLEFVNDPQLASNRIDRIISRVEAILDMWPENFTVHLYLHRGILRPNEVAFYEYKTKALNISVDYASDGVLAHEVAHAIINQYFATPPPSKVQEILSEYVDKHLWGDYY